MASQIRSKCFLFTISKERAFKRNKIANIIKDNIQQFKGITWVSKMALLHIIIILHSIKRLSLTFSTY